MLLLLLFHGCARLGLRAQPELGLQQLLPLQALVARLDGPLPLLGALPQPLDVAGVPKTRRDPGGRCSAMLLSLLVCDPAPGLRLAVSRLLRVRRPSRVAGSSRRRVRGLSATGWRLPLAVGSCVLLWSAVSVRRSPR